MLTRKHDLSSFIFSMNRRSTNSTNDLDNTSQAVTEHLDNTSQAVTEHLDREGKMRSFSTLRFPLNFNSLQLYRQRMLLFFTPHTVIPLTPPQPPLPFFTQIHGNHRAGKYGVTSVIFACIGLASPPKRGVPIKSPGKYSRQILHTYIQTDINTYFRNNII